MTEHAQSGVTRLEHAATTGVVALAVGSFVLSYDALHQLAVTNHVPKPLAWIWPLIVDGFIIVASLAVLHAVLRARPAAYPWLLVLAFSTVSVVFNVLHAAPTSVARLVAAIPPLTLVLSFELLMRQLRDQLAELDTDGNDAEQPAPLRTHRSDMPEKTETDRHTANPGGSLLQQAYRIREQHRRAGNPLTGKQLAHVLGISDGYARRLLRQIGELDSTSAAAETLVG